MEWFDIASIVFICVTANHLGLIGAVEGILGKSIPILNCPKCASFWFTMIYTIGKMGFSEIPLMLAISFLASYSAIWIELLEGYIDTLYLKIYGKITSEYSNDTLASDAERGNSDGTVSYM